MRKAFNVENGPLSDRTAEASERQALSDLFAGAMGVYKNAQSHREVGLDDPDETAEVPSGREKSGRTVRATDQPSAWPVMRHQRRATSLELRRARAAIVRPCLMQTYRARFSLHRS